MKVVQTYDMMIVRLYKIVIRQLYAGDDMKQELTALSGSEGEVLRILWDLGRGTVQCNKLYTLEREIS
jgi:hypothetical protein